jgi:hypothetical protein
VEEMKRKQEKENDEENDDEDKNMKSGQERIHNEQN